MIANARNWVTARLFFAGASDRAVTPTSIPNAPSTGSTGERRVRVVGLT
jgi:hypothetical protein